MKTSFVALFLGLLSLSCAQASVSIAFESGVIRDSSGTAVPVGTIGIVVVDSLGNGFAGTQSGAMTSSSYAGLVGLQLSAGQSVGDDVILGVFQATDVDVDGTAPLDRVFSGTLLNGYNYSGNIGAGDQLAIYWFPGVTTVGETLTAGQTEAGFYRNSANDLASNSQIGFVLPSDGSSNNLFAYDSNLTGDGGSASPSALTAVAIAAAPEPSRVLLLGLGALGLVTRRRRK